MATQTNESPDPKKVFVIHGRNLRARDAMFEFLKSAGLQPIEWDAAVARAPGATPFIGDVLTQAFTDAQSVVALFTGDDIARLGNRFDQEEPTPQARPNVIFEAGMAFGRLPKRTVLVRLGDMRMPSDMAGLLFVSMNNSLEKRKAMLKRLQSAGCQVDTNLNEDWQTRGDFESCVQPPDKATGKRNLLLSLLASAIIVTILVAAYWTLATKPQVLASVKFAGSIKPQKPGIIVGIVAGAMTATDSDGNYQIDVPKAEQGSYVGVVFDFGENRTRIQSIPVSNVDPGKGAGVFNYAFIQ